MNKEDRIKKGFTLVEIIVYMTVMSIFLVMISRAIMNVSYNRLVAIARSQVASQGNFALDKIRQAIVAASDFSVNAGNDELTIGNTVYSLDSENQRIRVVISSGGGGGDWEVAAAGDTGWNGSYYADGGSCLGKPSYRKDDQHWLVWNDPMWLLTDMCAGANLAYISNFSPDLPANPWFPAMSPPPAPTVSAGGGEVTTDFLTANSVSVTNLFFQAVGAGTGKTVKIGFDVSFAGFLSNNQIVRESFTTTVGLR